MVLGVNQLTTGLFRAMDEFARHPAIEGDATTFLADRILPHLPVYEVLQSLRCYHDPGQTFLKRLERALPAGNSALAAHREDVDALTKYLPLFQQELLRRHGVDVSDFFEGPRFIPQLLPTVRPDLAVAIDVTFASSPGSPAHKTFPLDKGITLGWGPNIHSGVYRAFLVSSIIPLSRPGAAAARPLHSSVHVCERGDYIKERIC